MVHVVLSKLENYADGAALISSSCEALGTSVVSIDIDDFSIDRIDSGVRVFFLTNDGRVGKLARSLIEKGVLVVNGDFLSGERSKSAAQQRAALAGVPIPKIRPVSSLMFPFYLKSEHHAQGVHRVETAEDLGVRLVGGNFPEGWYGEDAVDGPGRMLVKLYWVDGHCYGRDKDLPPREDVRDAMNVIAETFRFDMLSADFLVSKDSYWCIDINPAPALFGSTAARSRFAEQAARIQKRP